MYVLHGQELKIKESKRAKRKKSLTGKRGGNKNFGGY